MAISILLSYNVESKVMSQNKELNWLNEQINCKINDIQILKAELTHLITPERINRLQKRHLSLVEMRKDQFTILENQ